MTRAAPARDITLGRTTGHWRGVFRAMGSPCEVLVSTRSEATADELVHAVAAEAWRIEDKFSRYLPDNVIAHINSGEGATVAVDKETAGLLDFAAKLHELSEGRFDITSGVLREVWQFDGSDRVPGRADVEKVVSRIGWHNVLWQPPEIRLQPGMQIDLGGIGKEYAVDRAAGIVRGLSGCHALVNFGGDLACAGDAPPTEPWQVGIEHPDHGRRGAAHLIQLAQGALATSGDARRFLLKNGRRYSHILNPLTGWPIESVPRSVTVAADTCTQAGMLATLAMLSGADAEAFLALQGVKSWCLR